MVERTRQVPHSIRSLLYVKMNGNYYGYKPELNTDVLSGEWKQFLICSECNGISRNARQGSGKTVCEMCITGPAGNRDQRVEDKVESLNSRCPLARDGCDWEGKLREVETHMDNCDKLFV